MQVRSEFELAEVLWDAAEPRLTDAEQRGLWVALHAAHPFAVNHRLVEMLQRRRFPIPRISTTNCVGGFGGCRSYPNVIRTYRDTSPSG